MTLFVNPFTNSCRDFHWIFMGSSWALPWLYMGSTLVFTRTPPGLHPDFTQTSTTSHPIRNHFSTKTGTKIWRKIAGKFHATNMTL